MRFTINLASQKYEEIRRFVARATAAAAGLAFLALVLAGLAWLNYANTSRSLARITKLRQDIAALQQERAEAEAFENRPENRDVNQQKNFWNGQIYRRAFSFTQLFNDLQKIMPGRAYVMSVQPEITTDNRLKLKLAIAGEKHDNGLDLLRKMEASERFHGPKIMDEGTQVESRQGGATIFKFNIETYYNPPAIKAVRPAAKEGM